MCICMCVLYLHTYLRTHTLFYHYFPNSKAKQYKSQGIQQLKNVLTLHTPGWHTVSTATAAKLLQSCPALCDPIPGILQARTLEWVAISFSNAWKWKVKVKLLSHVWLFSTPWTAAHQAPLSMGFSRQEYWSGLPLSVQSTGKQWQDTGEWWSQCTTINVPKLAAKSCLPHPEQAP